MKQVGDIVEEMFKMQLNLDKIFKLPIEDKRIILDLYDKLINSFVSPGFASFPAGGMQFDMISANVMFNTLTENGYLVTRREKNLDEVLEK